MRGKPAATRQVLLAHALLVSVVAAAWVLAGQPLLDRLAQGELRISALQLRLEALRNKATSDSALHPQIAERQIEKLREFIHDSTIDAETLEIAGSLMQRRLTEIIEKHGGEQANIRLATDPDAATMMVSSQFGIDLAGISEILLELAETQPVMQVDLLSIRKRDRYLEAGQGAAKQDLVVQIDVSGFWGRLPAEEPG